MGMYHVSALVIAANFLLTIFIGTLKVRQLLTIITLTVWELGCGIRPKLDRRQTLVGKDYEAAR